MDARPGVSGSECCRDDAAVGGDTREHERRGVTCESAHLLAPLAERRFVDMVGARRDVGDLGHEGVHLVVARAGRERPRGVVIRPRSLRR